MSRGPYIALAGNIGSGKSSLTEWLAHHYRVEAIPEPNEDNPFLERFYGDMPRWSFHSQVWFLTRKLWVHQALVDIEGPVVQDRTLWEDAEIFAEHHALTGLMSPEEAATYRELYAATRRELRTPDLLVYLRCPVRTIRRRIRSRGRAMEQDIPAAYLRALHGLYEDFHDRWTACPKVVLDTSAIDPVTNVLDRADILATFDDLLPRRTP